MPISRLSDALAKRLETLGQENRLKGDESVICGVIPTRDSGGPRYLLEGEGDSSSPIGLPLLNEGTPTVAPENTPPLSLPPGAALPFDDHVEIRPSGNSRPLAGGAQAVLRAWIRPRTPIGDDAVRAAVLLDALAPSLFAVWREPLPVPTIELTAHFAPAAPATSWAAIVQRTVWRNDSYCVDDADLRNEDGILIAQARQRRRILDAPR